MTTDLELIKEQEAMFQPGCFVVLHPDSKRVGHWGPVPEFFVEEYEPRAKKRGWRVNERGMKMFRGWGYTAATEGKDDHA